MIKQSTIYILSVILLNYIFSTGISLVFYGTEISSFSYLGLISILFVVFLGLILGESILFEKKNKTFCFTFSFLFFFGTSFFISLGVLIFDNWTEIIAFEIENFGYIFFLLSGMFSIGNVFAAILLGYLLSTLNREKKLISAENISKNMISSEENPLQSIKTEEKSPSTEIKIPFSLLFIAILIEATLALITFLVFNGILDVFLMRDIAEISPYIGLGLVIMLIMAYLSHHFVNLRGATKAFCIWFGILFMFSSLHLSISISCMSYNFFNEFESGISFIIHLIFLIFGGVQTLCVGIWLGYQINKLRQ